MALMILQKIADLQMWLTCNCVVQTEHFDMKFNEMVSRAGL